MGKKKKMDKKRESFVADVMARVCFERAAQIAQSHICSFDCWSDDVNGESHRNGNCPSEIAREIRDAVPEQRRRNNA